MKVKFADDVEIPQPADSLSGLLVLNASGKLIYGGTVPVAEVRKRRAKNKVARKSRRVNRD